MFKTRRARRKEILDRFGFLPFESYELSKVPFSVPYMDAMMRTRRERLERAVAAQMTKQQYAESIIKEYREHNWYWVKYERRGAVVPYNPWKMFEAFEVKYKRKYPDYSSPWVHKKRDFRNWLKRVDAAVKKRQARNG